MKRDLRDISSDHMCGHYLDPNSKRLKYLRENLNIEHLMILVDY